MTGVGEGRPGPVRAGVIGVGSMGKNHARVYSEMQDVDLVGVVDADGARARAVADDYGTRPTDREALLEAVDVASVAVPTRHHYEAVLACIDAGVDVLVEKPFVDDLERGREVAELARSNDVTVQVGHIERFNPATRVLADIVPDLDVVAVDVQRLGPPIDRAIEESVVMDLMVHDIDILLSLVDAEVDTISAAARDERHVSVQFQFDDDSVAVLTASRLTQEKVRRCSVTATSCRVNVDFISQTVEIHRRSYPEYVETNGDIRYRHESVVERPMVENGEPLKAEIAAFIEAAREGTRPLVSAEDALETLAVANRIESLAFGPAEEEVPVR